MSELSSIIEIYTELGETRATPREIVSAIENNTDLSFIGRGANRAVFRQDDYVYKVPISSTGRQQNRESFDISRKLEGDDIVAIGEEYKEGILKQRYCSITKDESHWDELADKLDENGYEYLDWDESSVGINSSREPVLIDIAGLKI